MLSLLYGPPLTAIHEKTIALAIRIFVGKVMSQLFNILSGFVIAFLPRSKHLLISWLQSPSSDFGYQCSLDNSDFLEEISSLAYSILFPHFFALFP